MATIESDWDGTLRELGTNVTYSCAPGLETTDGSTQQLANCTDLGWMGELLPCDGEGEVEAREMDVGQAEGRERDRKKAGQRGRWFVR